MTNISRQILMIHKFIKPNHLSYGFLRYFFKGKVDTYKLWPIMHHQKWKQMCRNTQENHRLTCSLYCSVWHFNLLLEVFSDMLMTLNIRKLMKKNIFTLSVYTMFLIMYFRFPTLIHVSSLEIIIDDEEAHSVLV